MDTILIGIAGGTGSGKTTLADKLVESFGRDEVSIRAMINYYKRHDDIPFEERAKLNYVHPMPLIPTCYASTFSSESRKIHRDAGLRLCHA